MKKTILFAAALGLVAGAAHAQTQVEGTLTDDRYTYWIVSDGGAREQAPIFAYDGDDFPLDFFDSNMTAKWNVELPSEFVSTPFSVVSATLEVFVRPGDAWDPAEGDILLFAAGFTGDNGFTEATWTENSPYVGSTPFAAGDLDPFPIELGTGLRAEDNPDAEPWAVGDIADTNTTEGILVTFTLDVADPEVQAKLVADLNQGFSSWIFVSNYLAEQPGGTRNNGSIYPSVFTKEAVGQPGVPANVEAPKLTLEVESATSINNWVMYQ